MSGKYILDADGTPQVCDDLIAWAKWLETAERHVKQSERGGVNVSTVFLGLDHSFGVGEPMLFETMIFGGDQDGYQERYATRQEAIAGHERAVEMAFGPGASAGGQ